MRAPVKTALLALAVTLAGAASASAQVGTYTPCEVAGDATIIEVSGTTCGDARAAATAVAGTQAPGIEAALLAAGWTPLHVSKATGSPAYDLAAIRLCPASRQASGCGLAAMGLRLPGDAPDLDGWTANRELLFSSKVLVGGAAPPDDSTVCTSAFLVRLGTHVGGLTAAHCSGLTKAGQTRRRNTALRRPPLPGIVLGSVQRNLARRSKPIDVMVLPVPSGPGRPSANVVARLLYQPPWFVRGTARPLLGRRVCFSGDTSGPDNCGRIVRPFPGTKRLGLVCTDITAREGDSGSPVYTAPSAAGTVRAVGIANIVFGFFQSMCFVPIGPVLDALDATLVSAGG